MDLSQPLVIKNALMGSPAAEKWTLEWASESPRGDIVVDYFRDARTPAVEGGSVPDSKAPLREVLQLAREGEPVKTMTEMMFREFPALIEDLPLDRLHALFGNGHFRPWRVGNMLTVPIFVSKGTSEVSNSTRTDLHCEPIANVAIQLSGSKRWTIVSPSLTMEKGKIVPQPFDWTFACPLEDPGYEEHS